MDKVTDMDEPMNQMLEEAAKDGKVPRLLASFSVSQDNKVTASIGIEYIPEGDMLANLIPGENIFVIYTDWYSEMPLVISGPGAGKHVTAGGVQSDLNQLLGKLSPVINFRFNRRALKQPAFIFENIIVVTVAANVLRRLCTSNKVLEP